MPNSSHRLFPLDVSSRSLLVQTRTIVAISQDMRTIWLNQPLTYTHVSGACMSRGSLAQ